jgi:hypothetical protein
MATGDPRLAWVVVWPVTKAAAPAAALTEFPRVKVISLAAA